MLKPIPITLAAGVVISFDFGMTKTGIAIGDISLGSAKPLSVMKMNHGKFSADTLQKLVNEWQPVGFIVGLPLNMDGEQTHITRAAQKFSRRIAEQYCMPCELVDERLSSYIAEDMSKDSEHFWYKMSIDAISAALILETWLTERIRVKCAEQKESRDRAE